ncbi:hypothetical protein [Streptomyces barkulensis]|uniref:hypothetical protein n=1 Tax=Streptomyces barkulensis TaxID=1257026 RepID=UPI001F0FE710|nr:hypothetical protein [Streptomyces barkulensis]
MSGRPTPHLPSQGAESGTAAPFYPRLGDLAADTARGGRVGVVVALPGEGAATYHLQPPGGGTPWSAPADASTLRPVPAKATHATLLVRDALYDHRARQGSMAILVHHEDGSSTEAVLVLTPPDMERLHSQTERILTERERSLGGAP